MQKPLVDLSVYQAPVNIDYGTIASEISGAILRAGYTGWGTGKDYHYDSAFDTHERELRAIGVPLGVYWYSCATTSSQGEAEACKVLDKIAGRPWDYPIYIDVEDNHHQAHAGKDKLTEAVRGFCDLMESEGYYAGIYSTQGWMDRYMHQDQLLKYDFWRAHWAGLKPEDGRPYGLWQYTSRGRLNGFAGDLDLNRAYRDYPAIMRQNGLNGHKKTEPAIKPSAPRPVVYSPFYRRKVEVTGLMDPARIETGAAHVVTRSVPVEGGSWAAYQGHEGLDLAAPHRTPIYAAIDGQVKEVGTGHRFKGNHVYIENGPVTLGLYHLDEIHVKQGQKVTPTTRVGLQGMTGNVTGTHLHISLLINGRYADPYAYAAGERDLMADFQGAPSADRITWHRYKPGLYEALKPLEVTDKPRTAQKPKARVLGTLPKGLVFEAQEELREGVSGVQLGLGPDLYVYAQNGKDPLVRTRGVQKSLDDLAREVINGQWGVGNDRVQRLKEAGHDPQAVQARVNQLI